VSFFVLVVFLVDGFFTVAAFLVVVEAFFVEAEGFLVVGAFSVEVLVLLAGAFFAGAAFVFAAFFVVVLFLGGCVFCIGLSDNRWRGSMAMTYLLGIGRDSWPLRSQLDLARRALREDKGLFLSAAGKRQIELMKIRGRRHIEFVLLLSILEPYINKMVAMGSHQDLPS